MFFEFAKKKFSMLFFPNGNSRFIFHLRREAKIIEANICLIPDYVLSIGKVAVYLLCCAKDSRLFYSLNLFLEMLFQTEKVLNILKFVLYTILFIDDLF